MDNEKFKEILSEVGMNKKDFAEKVGLAYQTVAGWTNQGYPVWIDSYADMMVKLHECKDVGDKLKSAQDFNGDRLKSAVQDIRGEMAKEFEKIKEEMILSQKELDEILKKAQISK